MRALLLFALVAACERASPSPTPEPTPTPTPTPTPLPTPPPIKQTTIEGAITIILTTKDLWLEGSLVIEIKPTTQPEDITEAFERQFGRLDRPHSTEVVFRGEKAVAANHINAVIVAAKTAGFTNFTFKVL